MFYNKSSEIFIPDSSDYLTALSRTTHLSIGAHQDDIEIMSYHGIAECYGVEDKWFTGCVVTNGAGSPRSGIYANYSDKQMQIVRNKEQKKAAVIGEYSAQILLDYSSLDIKDNSNKNIINDLKNLIEICKPEIIYTHNPADKHDTHIAVMMRVLDAINMLDESHKPKKIYGCEVWRDLDWLPDDVKIALDVGKRENLANSLVGVFDSQICGGKRYDIAIMGRRKCHATFYKSHSVDSSSALTFAIDLTPVIYNQIDIERHTEKILDSFKSEVIKKVEIFRTK
ncbi:MAG: PIG-L family deacetylase [Armatimonadota bacterium]